MKNKVRFYISKISKSGLYKSLFVYRLNSIPSNFLFLLYSFIGWNFFGFLFIPVLVSIFSIFSSIKKKKTTIVVLKISIILFYWQLGSLFWMIEVENGILAMTINYCYYWLALFIFILTVKKLNFSHFFFIPYWLFFEYLINSISFSLPWLSLGNLMSNQIIFAQWYEFTGILGGSLWLLMISLLILNFFNHKKPLKTKYFLFGLISFPIVLSVLIFFYRKDISIENSNKITIVSFNKKYSDNNLSREKMSYDILKKIDPIKNYDYLLIPEQTIRGLDSKRYKKSLAINYFKKAIRSHKFKNVVVGTTGYKGKDTLLNSCLFINDSIIYRKVKRKPVPYSEYMPPLAYPYFSKKFYRIDTSDDNSKIIKNYSILTLICYESIFPFFTSNNIEKAKIIFLLSSEGFMKNNYVALKQYDNIIKLRAIENRVPIIKASNYGWSINIDTIGRVISKSDKEINEFELELKPFKKTLYKNFIRKYEFYILSIITILIYMFTKWKKSLL